MEQIFANPGFKHIADEIISNLDLKSMINFKQVNQTIASHFNSIKTCQLFFEKFMMKISNEELGQSKFFNAVPEHFILEKSKTCLSKFNPFEKCRTFMNQWGFWPDQINQSWMQDLNEKEKLQCNKLWKMYKFIDLSAHDLWHNYSDDLDLNDTLKSLVKDAFKSLNECPLILAVESRQEQLVKKMLRNGFLNICQCTNLNSLFKFARTYHLRDLAKYILMDESFLPFDKVNFKKNLEIAQRKRKCYETDDYHYILVSKFVANKIDEIKKYGRASPKAKRVRADSNSSDSSLVYTPSEFSTSYHRNSECVFVKDFKSLDWANI